MVDLVVDQEATLVPKPIEALVDLEGCTKWFHFWPHLVFAELYTSYSIVHPTKQI